MITKLAVYGTLKQGKLLHWYLNGTPLLTTDKLNGILHFDVTEELPVLTKGTKIVDVEVYNLDEKVLNNITRMEENAGYIRKLITLHSGLQAYCFFYPTIKDSFQEINEY